jgi:DNA-binding CsgD family transcriptional regulator
MPAHAPADVQRLLGLVSGVFAFEDLAQFRTGVLELLAELVPYDTAGYDEIGLGESFDVTRPAFDPALMPVFSELSHENPLVAHIRRTGDGRPRRISDVLDRHSFQRLALYQRFYRHVGVEFQVAFTLASCRPLIIGVALCRERVDFSEQEVELLALARPHLMHAYRHAEMLGAKTALIAALEAGLDTLGRHVVVLDPHGRIELATDGARRLLGDSGIRALPAAVSAWLDARDGDRRSMQPLAVNGRHGRLFVRALPTDRGDRRQLLLIEGATGELTPAALAGLGLTPREAQTLASVALGQTPAQTAATMGIARRTVDKHLQNIYAKLGTPTLPEAVAGAWAAMGLPSPDQAADRSARPQLDRSA